MTIEIIRITQAGNPAVVRLAQIGPMGPQGFSIIPRGEWDEDTVYAALDLVTVTVDGLVSSYLALAGDDPNEGLSPPDNPDRWQVVADAGAMVAELLAQIDALRPPSLDMSKPKNAALAYLLIGA